MSSDAIRCNSQCASQPPSNPDSPQVWDERYRAADTPWDMAQPSPPLLAFVKEGILPAARRVLVVGCGAGHELPPLADAGYEVTGADFSPLAIDVAKKHIAARKNARAVVADLLAPQSSLTGQQFDWIFDQTFFC